MRSFTAAAFATVALLCGAAPASAADFLDNFDGTAIDTTKWDMSHATSGERWCAAGTLGTSTDAAWNHFLNPGDWIDPRTEPCWGQTETSPDPYGTVGVDNGVMSLKAISPDHKTKTFPFVYSASDPFSTEDFSLQVRLRFTPQWGHGTWFAASAWSPTFAPNTSHGDGNVIAIVGDIQKTYVQVLDHEPRVDVNQPHQPVRQFWIPDPYDWHTYRLDYVDGAYTLFFDGTPVMGPIASTKRPSRLFMGNPVFTHWGESWWNPLDLDWVAVNGAGDDAPPDTDSDGVPDATDNCVDTANSTQTDTDADGVGDACEATLPPPDTDGDGDPDADDNCVDTPNPDQQDTDGDGAGDACDPPPAPDDDGDGFPNSSDNCPQDVNADQADEDGDGTGDACDATPFPDADGDGVRDSTDNCASLSNPGQDDVDGDGIGDACDSQPYGPADEQLDELIDLVEQLETAGNVGGGIQDKLQNALDAIETGQINTACNVLNAAANAINARSGKSISVADAEELLLGIARVRAELGC